jgi:hypothetical protein
MRASILLFALVPLLLHAAPASAQSYQQVVAIQLDSATVMFENSGFRSAPGVLRGESRGSLEDGGTFTIPMRLEAGTQYFFVGVCDQDCNDLDLFLKDEKGAQLASDVELDDVPIVEFVPTRSGTYLLDVGMVSCDASICYYGVSAFQGGK